MFKFFVVLYFFSTYAIAMDGNELKYIHGEWDCSSKAEDDLKLTNRINFNTYDMTFVHKGTATFIQGSDIESIIKSVAIGTFKYESSLLREKITDINIEIIRDDSGFLKGAKDSLKEAMLTGKKPLLTVSLNESNWVQLDKETNEITTCTKISDISS